MTGVSPKDLLISSNSRTVRVDPAGVPVSAAESSLDTEATSTSGRTVVHHIILFRETKNTFRSVLSVPLGFPDPLWRVHPTLFSE